METRLESRDGWIEVVHADIHVLAKGDTHLRDRLQSALAEAGEEDAIDVLTDALAADGVSRTPAFALVDAPGRRVLVRGSARVLVTGADGEVREFVAPARAPWSDEDLSTAATAVVLMTGEPEAEEAPESDVPRASDAAVEPEPESGPSGGRPQFVDGHLVSVHVGVGEAEVAAGESAAQAKPEPEPVVEPEPEPLHRTGTLPMSHDVPSAAPAAAVAPVAEAPIAAAPVAPAPTAAPEPAEETTGPGHLLLPTGETIALDRPVRLGRAPRLVADDEAGVEPHLLRVASPDNEISRNHAEVRRIGDRVLVRDLGSTNGTVVALPGETGDRLLPGEQRRIEPGTTIRLAGRVTIAYEAD